MSDTLTQLVVSSISSATREIETRRPGDAVVSFALCVDADLRTLYGAACTKGMLEASKDETFRVMPAEWSRLELNEPFDEASTLLERLADAEYAREGDEVGPDDDHLRPWKAALYAALVQGLRTHRDEGTFGEDIFLLASPHDFGDWWEQQVDASTKALNSPDLYEVWRKAWG